jgi:UbiD family decarboxylase
MVNHLKSLREYLEALEAIGEVQPIDREVDWNLEIGAICRRCYETGAPAPLFNTIKDIEPGFRVLGAPAGISSQPGLYLSRIAVSLGLAPQATGREIIESLVAARDRPLIPPQRVATGPCKENILIGDDVDLLRLPTPLLHDGDGGRYLNTYGIVIAQTPDKTWTNWSIARIMLLDKNRMTGIVAPFQHLGMIHGMWKAIDRPMPFALALGVEPFMPFVGGMPLPAHFSEADYVGAYFNEPVSVVRGETVKLDVPATAEIVIEGTLSVTETDREGPMGEYAGYLWEGLGTQKPVYHVSAMTFRNDPILPVSVAGEPVEENHTAWGLPNAAEIVYELRQAGLPVAMAWTPFESANHWYVIALQPDWHKTTGVNSAAICQQIGEVLTKTKAGLGTPKYLIVNDDIDITNLKEVVWAFATRNHPGQKGEILFEDEASNPLISYLEQAEKASMKSSKVIYNCLPPDEFVDNLPKRSSFAGVYPQSLQQQVLDNWHAYGFQR